MNRETITLLIGVGVAIVWFAAVAGGVYRHDYTALNIVTPVMLTVLGYLYIRRNGNGK
jgi:hypothetical protein